MPYVICIYYFPQVLGAEDYCDILIANLDYTTTENNLILGAVDLRNLALYSEEE